LIWAVKTALSSHLFAQIHVYNVTYIIHKSDLIIDFTGERLGWGWLEAGVVTKA